MFNKVFFMFFGDVFVFVDFILKIYVLVSYSKFYELLGWLRIG